MLRKSEGKRKRGQQRTRWLDGITNPMDMSLSKLGDGEGQGSLVCCSSWGHKELDRTYQLNNNIPSTSLGGKHTGSAFMQKLEFREVM